MDPILDRLVGEIDRDRLAATLARLVAIPSVNPFDESVQEGMGERLVAEHLSRQLGDLDWETRITEFAPSRASVLARLPGRGGSGERGSLMFAGHLDTVETDDYPAALTPVVSDGRVHGRGACDMKAALACYLEVARCIAGARVALDGDLLVAGVADEEYRQRGARAIAESGVRVDGVVIGEPTELRLCLATKGLAAFDIVVTGRATHGGTPEHGQNAIIEMSRLLARLDDGTAAMHDGLRHRLLGEPTLNVGTVVGGVAPNSVPESCTARVTRRLLPGETWDSVRKRLESVIGVGAESWQISDPWWMVDPYELDRETSFAEAVETAIRRIGRDPAPVGFPASSDAAYFRSPVVLLGPGSLAQAHSRDEWVSVDELEQATRVYLAIVCDMLIR